ncbi:MAG: YabP/YqfC family sporulation protein [Bacillota bacterium]|jgi:sporulation protein YabP
MEEKGHRLVLEDRRELALSGVTEVDRSEDHRVVLKTVLGDLAVEGRGLRVRDLDLNSGDAVIGGKIDALVYFEKRRGRERLFPGGKNALKR